MRNRKSLGCAVAMVLIFTAVFSNAARKDEITLVMVPREEEPVRLGMDLANRFPTLLISYKVGVNNAVSLHGWTGTQWVNVALDHFQSGDFFRKGPDSALIVEKAGAPIPASLVPPSNWCVSASKITTTEMRPLLHLVGQYYNFSYEDWQWVAKRYSQPLDAINPEGLNVAWYHKRMNEHLKPHEQHGASDLQYWVSIRQPEVVTLTPVAVPAAKEDVPAEEPEQLLTNDAPAAVIMGADDAAAESAEPVAKPAVEDEPAEEVPAPVEEPATKEAAPQEQSPGAVEAKAAVKPEEIQ